MAGLIQGQGPGTHRKQQGLGSLFRQGLRITQRSRWPYWHIDLNAGCGFNHEVGCQGSPLTFVDAAAEVGKPFNAMFCDHSPSAVAELRDRLRDPHMRTDGSSVRLACCDNADAPADWTQHGRAAGPIRNRQMAEYAEALIAVWDGKSRGTKNMIDEATKRGLKVYVHRV